MSDLFLKLWVQQKLNELALEMAGQVIQSTGRALPCSVLLVNPMNLGDSIVQVQFEVQTTAAQPLNLPPVIIPKAESEWMRAPTQVGDLGMVLPADAALGGISGLGSGVAQVGPGTAQGNLTNLVFVPVATTSFGAPPDPNKAWVNGPNGTVIGDSSGDNYTDIDHSAGTVGIIANNSVLLQTTSATAAEGLVRKVDLMDYLASYHAYLVTTYFPANFTSGSGWTQKTPATLPTPTSSTKSFSG